MKDSVGKALPYFDIGTVSGGFITGSGNAWLGGSSFGGGLSSGVSTGLSSGLSAAITGGFLGGLKSVSRTGNFWTGAGAITYTYIEVDTSLPIEVGEGMEYTNEYAKKVKEKHFPEVKGVDNLYADGTLPDKGEYEIVNEHVINKKTGKVIGGVTIPNGVGKGSNVYMFKDSFTSPKTLYLNMGHEFVHSGLYSMEVFDTNIHEYHAYKWSYLQTKGFGLKTDFFKTQCDFYRKIVGRVNPVNYKNMGLDILYDFPLW